MQNPSKKFSIDHEEAYMLNEPAMAYAQPGKRKVCTQELMAEGYMTLDQSKALIEKRIHNHFHS